MAGNMLPSSSGRKTLSGKSIMAVSGKCKASMACHRTGIDRYRSRLLSPVRLRCFPRNGHKQQFARDLLFDEHVDALAERAKQSVHLPVARLDRTLVWGIGHAVALRAAESGLTD